MSNGVYILLFVAIILILLFMRRAAGPARRSGDGSQSPDRRILPEGHRSPSGPPAETSIELTPPVTGRAYIVDGDTVMVRRLRVRLHGIDAPEMDQRGGAAARAHLFTLIAGQPVTVFPIAVDIHGRTVARIERAGTDLCRAMVADGFAVAYRRYSTHYVEDERAARAGRRGLWAECACTGIKSPAAHRYNARRYNTC